MSKNIRAVEPFPPEAGAPAAVTHALSGLLRSGLLSEQTTGLSDLSVADVSGRNRNVRVASASGPSYLLKHGDGDAEGSVAHEAAVYICLRSQRFKPLWPFLVRSYGLLTGEDTLVLELLDDARTLREHHAHTGRFSQRLAELAGDALATLHRVTSHGRNDETFERSPSARRPPFILSFHRPNSSIFGSYSSANLQFTKIVQRFTELESLLDALREDWQGEAVIHGDVRWDNLLVVPRTRPGGALGLRLIDWESARIGDPCWDVGAMFGAYLSCWLFSIPFLGGEAGEELERMLLLARHPLQKMQPAIRAFWRKYVARMRLDEARSARFALRATRYCGAYLIQSAYEYLQTCPHLDAAAICLLQLSFNVLRNPHVALTHLLGLQFTTTRSA